MGLPGAGKTLLANAIAEQLHWAVIDRDAFPRAEFDDPAKALATDATFRQVAALLSRRESCIVDGMTFADATQRARVRELARSHGGRAVLLWLDCPVGIAVERVKAQGVHPARDRDEALVRDVDRRFALPEPDVIRIDATQPGEAVARQALRVLG